MHAGYRLPTGRTNVLPPNVPRVRTDIRVGQPTSYEAGLEAGGPVAGPPSTQRFYLDGRTSSLFAVVNGSESTGTVERR